MALRANSGHPRLWLGVDGSTTAIAARPDVRVFVHALAGSKSDREAIAAGPLSAHKRQRSFLQRTHPVFVARPAAGSATTEYV